MSGQRIGYVRVSTLDQNPDRQLEQIAVDRTFTDKASGKDTARPQLDALLRFARDGDTVVVHSMDRLARNLDDLRRLVRSLTERGGQVAFVKEQLTFTGEDAPMATLLLSVMGAFAEFERADPGAAAGGGRLGQAARGVSRAQARALRSATGRTPSPHRDRRAENAGRAGVWDQSGDALPVSADGRVTDAMAIGALRCSTDCRVCAAGHRAGDRALLHTG